MFEKTWEIMTSKSWQRSKTFNQNSWQRMTGCQSLSIIIALVTKSSSLPIKKRKMLYTDLNDRWTVSVSVLSVGISILSLFSLHVHVESSTGLGLMHKKHKLVNKNSPECRKWNAWHFSSHGEDLQTPCSTGHGPAGKVSLIIPHWRWLPRRQPVTQHHSHRLCEQQPT